MKRQRTHIHTRKNKISRFFHGKVYGVATPEQKQKKKGEAYSEDGPRRHPRWRSRRHRDLRTRLMDHFSSLLARSPPRKIRINAYIHNREEREQFTAGRALSHIQGLYYYGGVKKNISRTVTSASGVVSAGWRAFMEILIHSDWLGRKSPKSRRTRSYIRFIAICW